MKVYAYTRYDSAYQLIDPYATGGFQLMVEDIKSGLADPPVPTDSFFRSYSLGVLPDGTYPFSHTLGREDKPDPNESNLPAWWVRPELDKGFKATPAPLGSLFAEWQWDQTLGSHFCYDTFGLCREPHIQYHKDAPWSPDELQHEIGHAIMYYAWGGIMAAESSKYLPLAPCNEHAIQTSLGGGNRDCAWEEGWADYWALYVYNDPVYVFPDGISWHNLDNATSNPPATWDVDDTTEGRIAGALWDVQDSAADGTDAVALGFSPIWNVFAQGPLVPYNEYFSNYWTRWKDSPNSECAATSIYQNTISYNASGWERCADATAEVKVGEHVAPLDRGSSIRVPVAVSRFELPNSVVQVSGPGGLGKFLHKITYSPDNNDDVRGVRVLDVTFDWFPNSTTELIDNGTGTTTFGGQNIAQGYQAPQDEAYLFLRLRGCASQQLTLAFDGNAQPFEPYTYFATGVGASPENTVNKTYRRGDARADGVLNMGDVLRIAQYVAYFDIQLGENSAMLHPVNAASVKWGSDVFGDKISIADALVLSEKLVGLRDDCYNLIPAEPPIRWAQSGDAAVEVGSVTLQPGQEAQVPVTIRNVNDSDGLGGYDLKITFDPAVVNITAIGGGQAPFDGSPTQNRDNVNGVVYFHALYSNPYNGPTGDIIVDYLTVKAVGPAGTSTALNVTVTSVIDTTGDAIPARDQDGTVTICPSASC